MNNIKAVEKINEQELKAGIYGGISKGSWHEKYKDSAWVYLGGFSFELSEGDLICVMSQWGEIDDINLVREKETNKSRGFAFIKYEDQRSTVLAVDNMNGTKLLGRTLRCDHVDQYKVPKQVKEQELEMLDVGKAVDIGPGHAYKGEDLETDHDINQGVNVWDNPKDEESEKEGRLEKPKKSKMEKKDKDKKKDKKEKIHKKEKKRKRSELLVSDENIEKIEKTDDKISNLSNTMNISEKRPFIPPPAPGVVASWRGNRDPTLLDAQRSTKPKLDRTENEIEEKKKRELKSYGGFNRIR